MKVSTLILVASLTNLALFTGCSMNRADSLKMLDRRAEYEEPTNSISVSEPGLKEAGLEGFSSRPVPVRTRPKVASIWIHPHEMASHDYFWGGWMSVVVEADQWLLSSPGAMPSAVGISDVTGVRQQPPLGRIPGAGPKLKPSLTKNAR